jgi:SRSO17 transposase
MGGRVTERGVVRWSRELGRAAGRIGPRFGRPELRARAAAYLRGPAADVERKNGRRLAEFAGEATPTSLQHFLGRAEWDADAVRGDLARYAADHHAPAGTPLRELAEIAGARRAIEECFEQAKQLAGLDGHEVRGRAGWRRHVTLSAFAHAMPAAIRARAAGRERRGPKKKGA